MLLSVLSPLSDVTAGPLICYILYLLLMSVAKYTHTVLQTQTLSLHYKFNAQDANCQTEPIRPQSK
jgi:hypothetical protein